MNNYDKYFSITLIVSCECVFYVTTKCWLSKNSSFSVHKAAAQGRIVCSALFFLAITTFVEAVERYSQPLHMCNHKMNSAFVLHPDSETNLYGLYSSGFDIQVISNSKVTCWFLSERIASICNGSTPNTTSESTASAERWLRCLVENHHEYSKTPLNTAPLNAVSILRGSIWIALNRTLSSYLLFMFL